MLIQYELLKTTSKRISKRRYEIEANKEYLEYLSLYCRESIFMKVSDIKYYIHREDYVMRFKKNSVESFQRYTEKP